MSIEEYEQTIAELKIAVEARNLQINQLDRDCRNLQERLRDALAAMPVSTTEVPKKRGRKKKETVVATTEQAPEPVSAPILPPPPVPAYLPPPPLPQF